MKRWIHASTTKYDWSDPLPQDVYDRLCECRSRKSDIPWIAFAKWKELVERKGQPDTKETLDWAYQEALEHLGMNNQFFDPTADEEDRMLHKVQKLISEYLKEDITASTDWPEDISVFENENWNRPDTDGAWSTYLMPIEEAILFNDLGLQCQDDGRMFFFIDEDADEVVSVDFDEYITNKCEMAMNAEGSKDYAKKFKAYIENLFKEKYGEDKVEGCDSVQASQDRWEDSESTWIQLKNYKGYEVIKEINRNDGIIYYWLNEPGDEGWNVNIYRSLEALKKDVDRVYGPYEAVESCDNIQASTGNSKGYYTGYGYPSTEEILEKAKEEGYKFYYWASDEDSYYKGMYNGDTIYVYKDINKLEDGYREDAERLGKPIE